MKILLQFPEGLKNKALEHAKRLEAEHNEVIISASPTFGACDLSLDEAKKLNADKLVHFGHAEFHHVDFNVEYVEYRVDAPLDVLNNSLAYIEQYSRIGVVTTVQHVHQLPAIKQFYEAHNKQVSIAKPYGFARHDGQILGCDVGSAANLDRDVECIVYFGGGIFHPLGAVLATKKPFLRVDPFENVVEFLDGQRVKYKKRSRGKVLSAIDANTFGILVSTKNGQHNLALAKILKQKIEAKGLSAAILISNSFDFTSIANMREFDAFVNTACPRIAIDDYDRVYGKPLLSGNELMEALAIKAELKQTRTTR